MKLLRVGGDHETILIRGVILFAFGKWIISCNPACVSCVAALDRNEEGEWYFCSGKLLAAVSSESPSALPPKTSRLIKAKPGRCMVSSLLVGRHVRQLRREELFLWARKPRMARISRMVRNDGPGCSRNHFFRYR